MANFKFTIPALTVDDLKGDTPGTNTAFECVADRGLGRSVKNTVLRAKFGDGYEQRVKDGINPKEDSFNISFVNRDAADINLIAAFLDDQAAKSFDFVVTELTGDNTMKVVTEEYNINYLQENYHSLTTTLRRVYEP